MASDEIVWQLIGQNFCSFKIKTKKENSFCRHEMNLTGLCSRQSCPLANCKQTFFVTVSPGRLEKLQERMFQTLTQHLRPARYATVRASSSTQTIYLYMKTIERAHLPSKLWQKIKLSQNYATALQQIDDHLIYWPKFLVHKAKQRLTRLTQVAARVRRLTAEDERLGEKVVTKRAPKIRRRESTRERKAEAAAHLERTIERELVQRLREGAYGDQPLNVSESVWQRVLREMEKDGEGQRDKDLDRGIAEEDEKEAEIEYEEEGEEEDDHVEYLSDFDESEDDLGDIEDWLGSEELNEESEPESGDSEGQAKTSATAGDKRKRGRKATRVQPKRKKTDQRGQEIEQEIEYARQEERLVL